MDEQEALDFYITLLYRECRRRFGSADPDKDERVKAFVSGFVLGMDLNWLPSSTIRQVQGEAL